jgi:translation elongation factor EF-G
MLRLKTFSYLTAHLPCQQYFQALRYANQDSLLNRRLIHSIRNVGVLAHIDAGKTTTTENILYLCGVTKSVGRVDNGDTVMDFLPQEKERGITISAAAISCNWKNHQINIIDT